MWQITGNQNTEYSSFQHSKAWCGRLGVRLVIKHLQVQHPVVVPLQAVHTLANMKPSSIICPHWPNDGDTLQMGSIDMSGTAPLFITN